MNKNSFLILFLVSILSLLGASFDLGITITSAYVEFNLSDVEQVNKTVYTNEDNVTIKIPVKYHLSNFLNVTIQKPIGWTNGFNWKLFEDGTEVAITHDVTHLFWNANFTETNVSLEFEVGPPDIIIDSEHLTQSIYEKNITISTSNHFTNVSTSTNVSIQHTFYNLYWYNGFFWVDKTNNYDLNIINGIATFSGFNTSNQRFIIRGYCQESWSCSVWSQSTCGIRTCTDLNNCGTTLLKPSIYTSCGGSSGSSSGGLVFPQTYTQTQTLDVVLIPFKLMPELISLEMKKGQHKTYSLTIVSNSESPINLFIEPEPSNSVISFETDFLKLSPLESNIFYFDIDIPKDFSSGVHIFNIIATSDNNYTQTTKVYLTVSDSAIQTNLKINKYNVIKGESFSTSYIILDSANIGTNPVHIVYYLKDSFTVRKVLKREDFIVDFEKTTYLERNFDIDMKEDSYQLCVDLYILNKTIVECEPLTITKKSLKESPASIKYEVEKGNLKNILIFFLVTMLIASTITTIVMVEIKKKYYLLGIPKRIKTRTELAKYLESVSYKIFSKYLGINRNDIADFVKYVFENESLEKELRRLEKKTDIIFALKNFEGETESEESGQKLDFNNQKKEQKSTEKIFQEEIAENIQDDKVSTLETETFKPEDKLEQEVLTEEKSLIDFSKQALTKDEYFYLFNGVVLKSISDLQSYLHVMPEDVFSHHVIFERNDFANWIEGVFKIPTLAEKVRLCKNKNELIEQMSKYG